MVKIDLHIHTQERSPCSRASEEQLIARAVRLGYGGLALTDHNRLAPPEHLADLNVRFAPFRIFGGIEISLNAENEHVVVLGVQDRALESGDWTYPRLYDFVRAREGFVVLAHPYRYRPYIGVDLAHYPPDAIEGYSLNTPVAALPEIQQWAERLRLAVLSNSDAHAVKSLGKYYNILERAPLYEQDLFDLLRAGAFTCDHPPLADAN